MAEIVDKLAQIVGDHMGYSTVIDRTAHKLVKAILEAMREPTEAMENAGMEEADKTSFSAAVGPIWSAMVDVALRE